MRTLIYNMACEYMAQTELFNRSLTDERKPDGRADVSDPYRNKLSKQYAKNLRDNYGGIWPEIKAEIDKHKNYTPDHWITEWCYENRA